ncbi:MAG: hypothetical protein ACI9ON_001984 [Limisphaerales bacterium]|jgi:hypothetical protein
MTPATLPLKLAILLLGVLSIPVASTETHPNVQAALGTSNGVQAIFDVDHYKLAHYQRKRKRWEKCVSQYNETLLTEFEALKTLCAVWADKCASQYHSN